VAYGKDPYMQMLPKGESLHYKIKEGDIIELRLKTNLISGTSDQIQLFYTTTADKTYTESKSVKSAQVLSANGGYKVIQFKMSRNIGEIINALRLDPYSNCSDNFKAEFELDYIYVGSPDQAPSAYTDSIFIDFNNDDRAVGRYMASDIYSSLNYDAKFWYYNAGRSAKPAISNSAGTMTLTIASTTDNYGSTGHSPYFQTTDVSMLGDTVPLNYVPTTKDVVQMRVKFEDCALISGGKARIRLYYIKNDDDGAQGIDTTDYITLVVDEGALSSGKWLTYTANVGTAFSSAQVINGIRPTFNGICSAAGKTGKITVDYVYVGPINGRPEQDSLMFDFTGSSADLLRYNSKTYGGYNYDDPSNVHWCVGGGSAAVDNKAGTLTLIPDASRASIYAYASRNSASITAPLSYDLTKADTFQIRLKLENVKTVSGKDPLVALDLFAGGTKIDLPDYTFTAAQVTSGKYVVATMPIAEEYRSYGVIEKLSVYLGNLELTTDSKVVIDYIYVGQSNNLPAQDHLFFGFTNTSVDTQRYATKTYSKNNYDAGNWAYNTARNSSPVFGSNTMSIRIAETTDNYSATGVSPFVQTSNNTGSLSVNVLNYYPGAEDYLQVRLCMTDCAVASGAAAVRLYYMTEAGGSMAGSVTKNLSDSALNGGEYITVTVPMSEASGYAASEVITAIRLAFPNVRSADGKTGVITLDYIYVGPKSGLPKPTYTVKFVGADGKTLYSEYVAHGETTVYRGATPKKTSDGTNHYSFKGWDKSLTNITANTTFTAQFTATAHSYTYEKVDGTNHKASCSCGYSKTGGHTWNSGAVTTAASCTAAGVKTYTCTACKATKTETIAKTAHTYGYRVSNAPTTSATGTLTGTCSACKGSTLVTLPKLNTTDYSYTVVKTATCGATGTGRYTWKTTAYGSFSFDVTIAKTTAHSYNSGVITKVPTLNAEGVKTYTCAICKGTKTEAVAKLHESLYMGFDNSAAAKTRYNNYTYGFHNFDLASQWRVAGSGTAAADHSAGTMSFLSGGNGNYLVAHASENPSAEGSPLYFDPAKAEVFQLRMKLENVGCVTGKTALVTVDLYAGNTKLDLPDRGLYEHQVLGGDYFLVTLPISEEFRTKGIVTNLHVYIGNITATASSKAVVDYIYVGSEEGLPTDAYTVTFKNYDGTVLQTQTVHKGETAVYTAAAPVKAHDSKYHYSFKGWDKALTNITSDTTVTAQFTSTAHSFIGGSCVCGAKENSDPVVDEGLRIYHTLDLASDISLNYAVLSSALSGYDMSTVRIELSKREYEGNVEIGVQNRTLYPDLVGNYYYFTLDGLLSIHMNDKISAVLYGEKNGVPSCSQTDLYSIADYAYSRLDNAGADAALKTLCADLLRYGSAAQTFKGYRTNALADAKMTAAHKAYLTDLDTVSFGGTNREYAALENAPIKWVGKTLDLANKVTVMYVFDASGYTGDIRDLSLRVNYKTYNGESVALTLSDAQSYGANANYYFFKLDQLLAAELRQPVSVAVYKGTERLSAVLQYSADTYGNNKTGALLTLCKSLFAYSDSALAYFQK
ncbi:MAG: hypothetical protein J6K89_00930, partial [Oscillospiraceae bacterium]|nr:hypothetical protein [Oscillospiraceae bacterium]